MLFMRQSHSCKPFVYLQVILNKRTRMSSEVNSDYQTRVVGMEVCFFIYEFQDLHMYG